MAAMHLFEPDPTTASPYLLLEPDPPTPLPARAYGWHFRTTNLGDLVVERYHADDYQGARVQHAIVRYAIGGASRSEIADFLCVSERQVVHTVYGESWVNYGQPVIRALKRLGIGEGRRKRRHEDAVRAAEIIAAYRQLAVQAADMLDGYPVPAEARSLLISDLRLLAAARVGPSCG